MKLFFDTETTGLPNWKLSPVHKEQPYIVQLAAILIDKNGKEVCTLNTLLNNPNCEIPTEATAVHGITTEMAAQYGMNPHYCLSFFNNMIQKANEFIGHNIAFDIFMLDIAMSKVGLSLSPLNHCDRFCTMNIATNIVGIPKNHGGGNKWPKLKEAYRFAFNEDFDGAHDAMNDVRATMRLYNWLQERNK